jgi:uncharacterized protein YbjT (DUF2867 family)
MRSMRVFVTGASGFVGGYLAPERSRTRSGALATQWYLPRSFAAALPRVPRKKSG